MSENILIRKPASISTTYNGQLVRPEPLTAYSYIRWSSDLQTKGDSLRRQSEITQHICKERGWRLDKSFLPDEGISAFTGENMEKGSLAHFLKAVKEGQINTPCVLVVEALDRLTRTRLRDARKLFDGLLEANVRICTANNGKIYDENSLDNPIDLFLSLAEMKAAHDYSANIARRVKAVWDKKREEAYSKSAIITKNVAAWLIPDTKNNKFNVDEIKANIVRRIFNDYANGKGIRFLVRELNQEKVAPFGKGKKNRGNGWSSTHLRRLLAFRGVLGEFQPHKYVASHKRIPDGEPIKDYYPAIIEKALFYKVYSKLAKNGHSSGCKRRVTNLFTGIVKCAHCGGSMFIKYSGQKKGKYSYTFLICSNGLRKNGCTYNAIRYPNVERAILTTFWAHILPVISEKSQYRSDLEKLESELSEVQIKEAAISNRIEIDGVCPDGIFKILNKYETRRKELEQQIESFSAKIDNNPLSFKPLPETINNRLRIQSILSEKIKIVLDAKNLKAIILVDGWAMRVKISWDNRDKDGFLIEGKEGENYRIAYADDVIVWETGKKDRKINVPCFVSAKP